MRTQAAIVQWFGRRGRRFAFALGWTGANAGARTAAHEKAYKILCAAARFALPAPECFIGFTYLFGPGRSDPPLGARWLLLGAGRGDAASQWLLGTLYEAGVGVPKNRVQAYVWTARAVRSGLTAAARDAAALQGLLSSDSDQMSAARLLLRETPRPASAA